MMSATCIAVSNICLWPRISRAIDLQVSEVPQLAQTYIFVPKFSGLGASKPSALSPAPPWGCIMQLWCRLCLQVV